MLCKKPRGVFEFEWTEGLGSTLYAMIVYLDYCLKHDYYFSLTKGFWPHTWTAYFKPFWDDNEKKAIYENLSKHVSVTIPQLYKTHVDGYWNRKGSNIFYPYQKTLERIYHLQEDVLEKVKTLTNTLTLPKDYAYLHIRKGDRVNHRSKTKCGCPCHVDPKIYLAKLPSHIKEVFIATDDFTVIETLSPYIKIHTLTSPSQRGNSSKNLLEEPLIIQLLTDIEIARNSTYFIGTYCSVLSHLMQALRLSPQNKELLF